MPLTATGKVDRSLLGQWAAADARSDAVASQDLPIGPDEDRLKAEITTIWAKVLGRPNIRTDEDFFDLGGHSLLAAQVMHEIGKCLGRSLPLRTFLADPTVDGLAMALRTAEGGTMPSSVSEDTVVCLKQGGAHAPLFCVPVAQGSALTYLPLARLLTTDQPVYALQFPLDDPPSHEHGPSRTVEQIAARFVSEVVKVTPSGPYRLCGHSYGAVLAYEMARQMLAAGASVELLAMFDAYVPLSRRKLPWHRRALLHLRRLAASGPRAAVSEIAKRFGIRGAERPAALCSGMASGVHDPDQAASDARTRAFRAYRPPPYTGVITLFRAAIRFEWERFDEPRPFNGWDTLCQRVAVHTVPGDHLTLMREPNLTALAAAVDGCLARWNEKPIRA